MLHDSWDSLAVALGISVRHIHRVKKQADAPKEPDETAWREYLDAQSATGAVPVVDLPYACAYDKAVAKGYPITVALHREKVRAAEIANEREEIALARTRGELFTAEDVAERDARWNNAVAAALEDGRRLADGLPGVSPDLRKAYMAAYQEWASKLRATLAKV